jgi:hypothetical protein
MELQFNFQVATLVRFTCGTYYDHPAVFEGIDMSDHKCPAALLRTSLLIENKGKQEYVHRNYVLQTEVRRIPLNWIDRISLLHQPEVKMADFLPMAKNAENMATKAQLADNP